MSLIQRVPGPGGVLFDLIIEEFGEPDEYIFPNIAEWNFKTRVKYRYSRPNYELNNKEKTESVGERTVKTKITLEENQVEIGLISPGRGFLRFYKKYHPDNILSYKSFKDFFIRELGEENIFPY